MKQLTIYTKNRAYIIEDDDESLQMQRRVYSSQDELFDAVKDYRKKIDHYYLSVEEGTGIFHRIHYILFA